MKTDAFMHVSLETYIPQRTTNSLILHRSTELRSLRLTETRDLTKQSKTKGVRIFFLPTTGITNSLMIRWVSSSEEIALNRGGTITSSDWRTHSDSAKPNESPKSRNDYR